MAASNISSPSAQAESKPSAQAESNSNFSPQNPMEIDILIDNIGTMDHVATDNRPVIHSGKKSSHDDFWFDFEQVKIPESIPNLADKDCGLVSDSGIFSGPEKETEIIFDGISDDLVSTEILGSSLPFLCVEDDMSHFKAFARVPGHLNESNDSTSVLVESCKELPVFRSPYQLILLGRNDDDYKQQINLYVDEDLLLRLSRIASGPNAMLVELALAYMIKSLEKAQQEGLAVAILDAKDVRDLIS